MAEQTTPVQRRVALKIIKAGMDTRQVIARFEAERQALALMDHPNIAKVFDAGVTETGRPYFVMELVKGTPITKYCDEHRLTPRHRLELFVQVCHAVQHAHQKGIIHRDLKPTNVLVAQYDGKPVPKVIDFGVAKATGQQLTERTMFTGFGDVIGTPQYMSPEQAEVNQLDVDTRSDIYSLGVLLYELLTGTTPLEGKRVREAALLEVLRVIREEEPPRPSTRLTATAELPSIAAQRGVEPKKLSGIVKGELDWIVMKALEKDRARRYETANGLAMDVQRYLTDDTVQACPPSSVYRLQKFARRNRGPLLASAAIAVMLLLLVGGLAVSTVRVTRERNEKSAALKEREAALTSARQSAARADAERQRAESNFSKARNAVASIMARAATGQAEWAKLSPDLRKIFVAETARYYESLIQGAGTEPSVRYETAVGYRSLGFLHGSAKEFQPAEKYYRQSVEMLEALVKESPVNSEYREQLASSSLHLGSALKATTRPAEARKAYERAAELYEELIGERDMPKVEHSYDLNRCYTALGQLAPSRVLEPQFRERMVRARRAFIERDPKNYAHYVQLGNLLREQRKLDEALVAYRKAVEINPSHAPSYQNIAFVLEQQGKFDEALPAARKAVELNPKADGAWINLGTALRLAKKFDEAAAAYRKAIELDPKDGSAYGHVGRPRGVSPQVAGYDGLASLLHQQKKLDEAAGVWRELIDRDPGLVSAHLGLGQVLVDQQKHPEAVAEFKKALAIDPKFAQGHNDVAWLLATASDMQLRDPDLALALAKKALELEPKNGAYLNTLGVARYRSGDWTGAITALERSMELRQSGDSSDWFFMAMSHWQLGEKDKSRESYDQAVKWMQKNAPKHPELIRFRNEAAALLGVNESK